MIPGNPEFTKNVKLEFNLTRFVIPLILLFLIVWIGWSSEPHMRAYYTQYTSDQMKAKTLYGWLCGFGFLFTILWGTYLVSNSLLEEIKVKTWDFVRMSSLSPMKILTGKIFGATSVIWTVTLLGIVPCLMYAGAVMIPRDGIVRPEAMTLAVLWLSLFFWAVLSYALAILLGLAADSRTSRGGPFSNTIVIFLIGTTIGGLMTELFEAFYKIEQIPRNRITHLNTYSMATLDPLPSGAVIVEPDVSYIMDPVVTYWYGLKCYNFDLLLMVLAFFAAWAFIGAWRALRKSLQYHDAPWVWTGFVVAASVFLHGFRFSGIHGGHFIRDTFYWPIMVSLGTLFFACITEAGDIIRYRAFARNLAARARYEAFREMPLWMISFAVLAVSIVLSLFSAGLSGRVLLFFISLLGYVVRDLLVFHAISWAPNVRRPLVGLAVFMAVAYGLMPLLANTAASNTGYLFYPLIDHDSSAAYWIYLALGIAVAAFFCLRRWNSVFGQVDAAPEKVPA